MSTSETQLVNLLLEKTEKDIIKWHSITEPFFTVSESVTGLLEVNYRCEPNGQQFDLQFNFWSAALSIDGGWVSDDSKLLRKLQKPVKQNIERALAAKREQRMQESLRKLNHTGCKCETVRD